MGSLRSGLAGRDPRKSTPRSKDNPPGYRGDAEKQHPQSPGGPAPVNFEFPRSTHHEPIGPAKTPCKIENNGGGAVFYATRVLRAASRGPSI